MKAILFSTLVLLGNALGITHDPAPQNLGLAVSTVPQGGTGASSFVAGECLKGNGTGPITTGACASGGGGVTSAFEIATTSNIAAPQIAYFTQAGGRTTLGGVATSSLAVGTGLTSSGTLGAQVGGTNSSISFASIAANSLWANITGSSAVPSVIATSSLFLNASAAATGLLTSTDWSTFNAKQAAGNYITALTGDVSASGPGSAASTLATVNGNVGSFTNANITVNAKGLITAAANGTGGSGTSAYEIATTSTIAVPQVAYFTQASGRTTLGGVATTTFTPSAAFTTTGTIGSFVGGANSTLDLANNGVAIGKLATLAANSVIGNLTGGTATPTAVATSSLFAAAANGQVLARVGDGWTGVATTTFNSPLSWSSGAVSLSTAGTWSGNAGTATALAANGTNCSAGSYPLGVDASGNSENCTVAGTGAGDPFTHPSALTSATTSLMLFNGQASSTQFSAYTAYFGGTATSTFSTAGALTLATPLLVASGGTGASSFTTTGNGVYYDGTKLATAPTTAKVTYPYASSTAITVSGYSNIGTCTNALGTGSTNVYSDICGSDNTTSGINQVISNQNSGASAYSTLAFFNDRADSSGAHLAAISYTGSNYNDNTFGTAMNVKNRFQIQNFDGPVTTLISTTTAANAFANWVLGGSAVANERMRLTSAGFLGIGTTTPYAQLSVNPTAANGSAPSFVIGSSTATTFLVTNAGKIGVATTTPWAQFSINPIATNASAPSFAVGSTTGTSLVVTNAGLVGVGTANPNKIFMVEGNQTGGVARIQRDFAAAVNNVVGTYDVNLNETSGFQNLTGPAQTYSISNAGGTPNIMGDIFAIRNGADNTGSISLRGYSTGTNQNGLTIDGATSDVALASTSPSSILCGTSSLCITDAGVAAAGSGLGARIFLVDGTTAPKVSFLISSSTASETEIGSKSNMPLTFWTNNTKQATLSTAGFLGIGTTTPYGQFSINPVAANATAPSFVIGSSTGTSMVVTNAGSVGIGTVSPAARLDITGNVYPLLRIVNTGTGSAANDYAGIQFGNPSIKYQMIVGAPSDATYANKWYLFDETNVAVRMLVNTNGNIGIGTAAPYERLDVVGPDAKLRIGSDTNDAGTIGVLFSNSTSNQYEKSAIFATPTGGGFGRNDLSFALNSVGDNTNVSTSDTRMKILNTGQVGIGTSTPSQSLDVNGSINIESKTAPLILHDDSNGLCYAVTSHNGVLTETARACQ